LPRPNNALHQTWQTAAPVSFGIYRPDCQAFTDGSVDGGFIRTGQQPSKTGGAVPVVLYALDPGYTHAAVDAAGGIPVKDIFQFAEPNHNELAVWSDR
jgi:predicted enzyme related to lactoylglutathione lyase